MDFRAQRKMDQKLDTYGQTMLQSFTEQSSPPAGIHLFMQPRYNGCTAPHGSRTAQSRRVRLWNVEARLRHLEVWMRG